MQKKWICQNIKTNKVEVSEKEMKQRLAEVVVLIFNQKSQLSHKPCPIPESTAFVLPAPQHKRTA